MPPITVKEGEVPLLREGGGRRVYVAFQPGGAAVDVELARAVPPVDRATLAVELEALLVRPVERGMGTDEVELVPVGTTLEVVLFQPTAPGEEETLGLTAVPEDEGTRIVVVEFEPVTVGVVVEVVELR